MNFALTNHLVGDKHLSLTTSEWEFNQQQILILPTQAAAKVGLDSKGGFPYISFATFCEIMVGLSASNMSVPENGGYEQGEWRTMEFMGTSLLD